MCDNNTVYIIGESRTNMDNAITIIYNSFYMGFEVNVETDDIVDVGCVHTIGITESFVKKIFIGKNMLEFEKDIESVIKKRYHGTSQKAILVSYKDALRKYIDIKKKYY
ncbi:DUF3870 domain-containing protein [Sedimentibacter sp. MB31-C6]|uniref:DUF3870 domain-containing protein n=1 Tax=Sedimentibacter sp. MB31-C6 TaxID=3109366 RepID=UPI002DDD59ED|nr:DUF3870 domain-containing protein [Sedimentibacter sp. MB36-C1]WSI05375.1 DUF3870 domain-containing protein [Sedimentibacter sp. MB36-C1]